MRSGVSFPSYASEVTWSVGSGAWNASYPLSNLADLKSIRSVARASAAGARTVNFALPAPRPVRFLALVHHKLSTTSTVRVQFYSGAGQTGTLLYDSGVVLAWPSGSAPGLFAGVRPFLLDEAVTIQSGTITIAGDAALVVEIGGIELSGFWEWTDVAVPRAFGLANRDVVISKPVGYQEAMKQWSPRTLTGSREVVEQDENESTALDFFRDRKTSKPFIWLWDYADPATWRNEAMLVVNASLPPPNAHAYPAGRLSFNFQEHIG